MVAVLHSRFALLAGFRHLRPGPLLAVSMLVMASAGHAAVAAPADELIELGRLIYQQGMVAAGTPLRGMRPALIDVEGEAAACAKCHRPSGMGSLEGGIAVPPVTGRFLFATQDRPVALVDMRAPKDLTRAHAPYTDESLAKALREGINVGGRTMHPVMPRYALTESQLKALTAYLRQLSVDLSPGVGADTVRFATIITPEVARERKDILLTMMRTAFTQRNASQIRLSGRMRMPIDLLPRTKRDWELSVWELKGEPQTWVAQLDEYYRREPAFAVISGLTNSTWEPMQAFCERQKIPCMFPSIALPPETPGFYSLYYSRGVALEADVLARHLRDMKDKAPQRLLQIYRDNQAGNGAARELAKALDKSAIRVEDRVLRAHESADLNGVLAGLTANDAVVLWLPADELAAMKDATADAGKASVYLSGFLVQGAYRNFSPAWQSRVRVIYPYAIGEQRQTNLVTYQQWMTGWNLSREDEEFQSEVFFNLLILTDLTSQMLDNFYRDYLIERAEDLLGWGTDSAAYPRLSLAPGQRFASKGAYIVRLEGGKPVADSDWIVP